MIMRLRPAAPMTDFRYLISMHEFSVVHIYVNILTVENKLIVADGCFFLYVPTSMIIIRNSFHISA